MKIIHYINLTNGIQAISDYNLKDYRAIRIPSSWCERKKFNEILFSLSDDLLLNLALGNKCIIYDYGANKLCPRAIWQGVEWIKFVLYKRWYYVDYELQGRLTTSKAYFEELHADLHNSTKRKVDYYQKFCRGIFDLHTITSSIKESDNLYKQIFECKLPRESLVYDFEANSWV